MKFTEKTEPAACDWYDMVKEFHVRFEHPVSNVIRPMHVEHRRYRAQWLTEEMIEFVMADHIAEQADALLDIIVFALGTFVEMGVDPRELFDVVHFANMAKLWPDGKPRYNTNGKIMKPRTWESPKNKIHKILMAREKEQPNEDIPF